MSREVRADPTKLRARLLAFYRAQRRDLPWRRTRDPYAIWVSEVMLQQTQVDTVAPRYEQFLRRFPSLERLARASEAEVCEAWAGLGYYRRARNLHAAARYVREHLHGELPRTAAELRALPGVGRYTAGAVASIAFGEEAPVVDGNVARVLSRVFMVEAPPDSAAGQRRLWELAAELVKGPAPGDLNQALMELGATTCTPRAPRCPACPLREACLARAAGDPTRLPVPGRAPSRRRLEVAFAWLEDRHGVWLRRRPLEGLWAGLWEPPSVEGRAAKRRLEEALGGRGLVLLTEVRHELTHRAVRARVYGLGENVDAALCRELGCERVKQPLDAPLSALARKVALAAVAQRRRNTGHPRRPRR